MEAVGTVVPQTPKPQTGSGDLPSTTASPETLNATLAWVREATGRRESVGLTTPPPSVAAALPALVERLQSRLSPADPKGYAVAMSKLSTFVRTFGLPAADVKAATEIYRETLGDLPLDLLEEAITATIREHRFHVLPKPAEIREHVSEKLARRKLDLLWAEAVKRQT